MKLLLINPPFQRLKGIAHIYFPLGLGYLCSAASLDKRIDAMIYNAEVPDALERLSFHVRYQDMLKLHNNYLDALKDQDHYVWREVEQVLRQFQPDLVGISVMTAKYGSALKVSQIVKSHNPNCRVLWGGPHATIDAENSLRNDAVDLVIRGEGEQTLKDLLVALLKKETNPQKELSQIAGLSYKVGAKILHNQARGLTANLDSLGLPQKDQLFFKHRYLPSSWGDMITSRGCPFRCGYCSAHNTWGRQVRFRSPEKTLAEIKGIIARHNTRQFYFWDDNFTLSRERTISLCRLLRQNPGRISWGCTTRVDLLDEQVLKEMKQAGCNQISIGIESGSEEMLKKINKGITLKKAEAAVGLLNKYGLEYEAFFMAGFPEETEKDLQETFNLIKQLKRARVCFSIFTPYPGTEQYQAARRYNLIPEQPDWSRFSHQSGDNHFMKDVDQKSFRSYVTEVCSWVDASNARNISLARLFANAFLNFDLLIKRPALLANKAKTFLTIIKNKFKIGQINHA